MKLFELVMARLSESWRRRQFIRHAREEAEAMDKAKREFARRYPRIFDNPKSDEHLGERD